jgi:type IV pilus assembly protein PilN
MIRINLIAADRDRARRRAFGSGLGLEGTQQKITLACILILVLTGLGVGGWYWSLRSQSNRLDQEIVTSQQETARLRGIIQQVQAFEARRQQLQLRVSLIEELRKGRDAPVHMLDEISRSVPDLLWLTEVKQQGPELTITGKCLSLTALSDFADNLKGSGYFKPVEIIESQAEAAPPGGGPAPNKFTVKATFVTPGT